MKVVPGAAATPVAGIAPAVAELRTPATAAPGAASKLQSSVLQPAMAAMSEMPDIDHAKVAALKTALERGELPFNPAKLAALIERYHRSGR
ncbi:flagellar biosynthesis anti-sigma factor FlgM [Peristeroidobacter soli]|jgi:negative regulator of flagellin synthesis FlgM|uniref:flagellar biosynthesis anti-sigma factor FlgM n=1 Tax=Peristeroidobacter soli TaxID=2497877 RepID=UPI00101BFBF2|nr:flagellar biosynthesis anti-sigma factor FlgM [Peristeroidobacter soli]